MIALTSTFLAILAVLVAPIASSPIAYSSGGSGPPPSSRNPSPSRPVTSIHLVEDTTSTEYQNYADYLKWQLFELSMSRNAGPVVVGPPQIRLDRHQVALAMSPNQGRVVVGPQTRLDRHQLALAMSPNQGRVVLEQQGRVKRSSAYVIDAVDQLALERTRRMADV